MKLAVVGCGQCGGRIADEFARLNRRARSQRGTEIITGAFAVNTDSADLAGLSAIPSDYQHRILIGGRKTSGHGVGKINELGAEIAKDDGDKVIDAIRTIKRLFETDAFLVIASAAGGTGSGSLPVVTQLLKERYRDVPIYALVILPFEHEEDCEARTIYNSALCLKSVGSVADAVFLVDNQRYIRKDFSLRNNLAKINAMIAAPFYSLLCAGEEKRSKYVGAKILDAGDIMATLKGWTVIGWGNSQLSTWKPNLPWDDRKNYRTKSAETHKGIQAMDEAIGELSLKCNPKDAGRALYLLTAPAKEMNMDLVKELGDYLKDLAPEATIRNGDYPRDRGMLEVTVVLSELKNLDKIREYYSFTTTIIPMMKQKQENIQENLKDLDEIGKDIPSLL